ncbi:hypothetical protein L915_06139 [Phytophthora nicotianae]|uniref:Uncharacterized protein n=1 Tax=Phytophthora nicotianae TaxID=4792 RepID=W2H446_PHYNI|nr:hypothetical protein L915_06139 [Phytophthora nicotianae]
MFGKTLKVWQSSFVRGMDFWIAFARSRRPS